MATGRALLSTLSNPAVTSSLMDKLDICIWLFVEITLWSSKWKEWLSVSAYITTVTNRKTTISISRNLLGKDILILLEIIER